MKDPASAARTFSVAYCVLYVVALALDLPAFSYFPISGRFEFGRPEPGAGEVAMAWYGLVVTAATGALAVAAIVPARLAGRAVARSMWLPASLAMLACAVLMRGFFA